MERPQAIRHLAEKGGKNRKTARSESADTAEQASRQVTSSSGLGTTVSMSSASFATTDGLPPRVLTKSENRQDRLLSFCYHQSGSYQYA
ncbi:hypothetical protein GJ496_001406 [Pomphorhynchus laevis]|nr:hypothetical protein GJ496_001406 [Pomphorhynchus laevis]